ncbi:Molybdopterin oxidoreductase [Minicystis rosea]|nr:Molybdopterin oxidoreductase [Minicystis rosea]
MAGPLIANTPSDDDLSRQLLEPLWKPRSLVGWGAAFGIALGLTSLLVVAITYTVLTGIGTWGNNIPAAWAYAITNFVWWIGIGHAGTFISAILLLLEQKWRTSINRFAEAMTLFAVTQAGLFPLLHLGRPWFAYWIFPYPATMQVWPQFRSALPWDAAAIGTYFTVSLLFWYMGLVPDLATLRDHAPGRWRRIIYGLMSFGWRGSASAFRHYRMLYGLLGGLATPLVLSVHSIVSTDFAIALVPGWHSTIFPPFFVAGAIFSGFAMVLTLLIPVRRIYGLDNVITKRHLDDLGKMTLVTGWIVILSYIIENFLAWYSGSPYEIHQFFHTRPRGPNSGVFWAQHVCNVLVPQLLWSKSIRTSPVALWIISILINVGMWSERFTLIVQSLEQDFLPSAWHGYSPTWVDWSLLIGTMGFFMLLFLSFMRLLPFIPVAEVKELNREAQEKAHGAEGG